MKLKWTPVNQIVFAIGLAAISILVGFYLANKNTNLSYAIDKNYLFAEIKEEVPDLKILWGGQPVQNFYSSRIAVWNSGDNFIDSSQLYSKDPIRIIIPSSVKLLSQKIDNKSRENLAVSTLIKELNGQTIIQVSMDNGEAVESGDGFSIKLYFTSESPSDFEMLGRIKGAPHGLVREDWEQIFRDKKSEFPIWLVMVILLLSLLSEIIRYSIGRNNIRLADAAYIACTASGLILVVYFLIIPTYFGLNWIK